MRTDKKSSIQREINDLYRKLNIDIKQAKKNFDFYTKKNPRSCLYEKYDYRFSFINSLKAKIK